ncbi:hypothetical protein BJ170DRAFT_105466 [Xylariales sp. AK1849]|nr:hypothetical protein BJ170DRAFT_105466 [Xylariales sp. AK1849]
MLQRFLLLLSAYIAKLLKPLSAKFISKSRGISCDELTPSSNEVDECAVENDKLAELWRRSEVEGVRIGFAAIDVHTSGGNDGEITDIGLSTWSLSELSRVHSYHWRIEGIASQSLGSRHFLFGATASMPLPDITIELLGFLESYCLRFGELYLVGHDVSRLLSQLAPSLQMFKTLSFIDTQKIWQFQNHYTSAVSLSDCLGSTTIKMDQYSLENAGNGAFYTLMLLQEFALRAQDPGYKDTHRSHIPI